MDVNHTIGVVVQFFHLVAVLMLTIKLTKTMTTYKHTL